MDDLFNFDINLPVPRFKYLLFVTLLLIPPDSYRDNAEQRLLKVCVRRTPLELACRIKIIVFPNAWCYPPSIHNFIPLIAAGALPFSVARPDESVRTGKKIPKMLPLRLLL